ncbi:MAG: peptide chain release factor N(5)-glutamine methyltransferase [Candidatus Pacebacteria bacterium]|nr:peptide chain release factor N(5)-glutamine methyltransferase [Candidatus Paceibacterota bacterium]
MISQDIEWLLKEKYNGEKTEGFFTDCKSLVLGTPLAYLIGWVPFLGCKIYLDSHPLIPRPETEYWVEKAITEIKKTDTEKPYVLDLCAGSGCIGTAVAKALKNSLVDFSEIDERQVPTINKNLEKNSIQDDRYKVFHTSLFDASSNKKYDFILSNPPYIDEKLERTEQTVIANEPYVALFGGKDGMEIVTQIIEQAPNFLNSGGQLWMEHEPEQSGAIKTLGGKNLFSVKVHKDQYGIERYSILVLQ